MNYSNLIYYDYWAVLIPLTPTGYRGRRGIPGRNILVWNTKVGGYVDTGGGGVGMDRYILDSFHSTGELLSF